MVTNLNSRFSYKEEFDRDQLVYNSTPIHSVKVMPV